MQATLLKKRPWHRCFPVNFAKFLRTLFLQNTSGWLLLYLPCYPLKIKTYFDNTLSFRFSGKLSTHTLARIINRNLAENIKLVWWQKLCFTFVTKFVHLEKLTSNYIYNLKILLLLTEAYCGSINWCSGFYPSGFGVPDLVFQVLVFRIWYSVSGFYRSGFGVPVFRFLLFHCSLLFYMPFFRDVNKTSHWAEANMIGGRLFKIFYWVFRYEKGIVVL